MISIASWNVNGIRAAEKKGFFGWMEKAGPDIVCVQETKAQPDQLGEQFLEPEGYTPHWASAQKKGYSGVVTYTKSEPLDVSLFGHADFDNEGRVLILEYDALSVINAYFPNSQPGGARLDYKLAFCSGMLEHCAKLMKEKRNFVLCGDFNIAHKPIDLAHPKANEKNPGYLPEERAWMDSFADSGFVDTFRMLNKEPENYTWWSYRSNAREKNIGWRLDYHWVPESFAKKIKKAEIWSDVLGSDHCPVMVEVAV